MMDQQIPYKLEKNSKSKSNSSILKPGKHKVIQTKTSLLPIVKELKMPPKKYVSKKS